MSALLQTTAGDIAIVGRQLSFMTGTAQKAQKIQDVLKLAEGEWFADARVGVPYLQKILGQKNPDVGAVRRILLDAILSVPGVAVADVALVFDPNKRRFSYSWNATDDEGQQIPGGDSTPLILGSP